MLGKKDGMIWNKCQAWMDDWDRGYRGERMVIMSPIQDILKWSWLQNTEMKTQQAVRTQAKKKKTQRDQNGGVEFCGTGICIFFCK